jgi:hypothetical protein
MESKPKSPEVLNTGSLLELARSLGLVENLPMTFLRKEIIAAIQRKQPIGDRLGQYEDLAHGLIDRIDTANVTDAYPRAQIGLMVMKLSIYKEAGDQDAYEAELNDTLDYASNMGFVEMTYALDSIDSEGEGEEVTEIRGKVAKL